MTVIHRPEIFRRPLNVHVVNATQRRRLSNLEPGRSVMGDAIWIFVIAGMVAFLVIWGVLG